MENRNPKKRSRSPTTVLPHPHSSPLPTLDGSLLGYPANPSLLRPHFPSRRPIPKRCLRRNEAQSERRGGRAAAAAAAAAWREEGCFEQPDPAMGVITRAQVKRMKSQQPDSEELPPRGGREMGGPNLISILPDEVLGNVISLLPTKEGARTQIPLLQ